MSHVRRQVSGVRCQVSGVTFQVSGVACNFFIFYFFLQSGEASWWRVCYQRGLPRLVCYNIACMGANLVMLTPDKCLKFIKLAVSIAFLLMQSLGCPWINR